MFWSGWPFVGVIFLPIGLIMLAEIYSNNGMKGAARFVIQAVGVVVCTVAPAVAIDLVFYKRFTLPWMNIMSVPLLYVVYATLTCVNSGYTMPWPGLAMNFMALLQYRIT